MIALTLTHKIAEIIGYLGIIVFAIFLIVLVVLIVHFNRRPPETRK